MPSFFRLNVSYFCPACRAKNFIESVTESLSSNQDEVAQTATSLPLKCAACKHVAPRGTNMLVNVFSLSADEYVEWIAAHQSSLHIHTERKTPN